MILCQGKITRLTESTVHLVFSIVSIGYYSLLSDQIKSFNSKLTLTSDLQSEYSQQVKDLTREYSLAFRNCLDQMHPMISLPDPHPPSDRRDSRTASELTSKKETNVKDILARASNGIMFVPVAAENSSESPCPMQDCGRLYTCYTVNSRNRNTRGLLTSVRITWSYLHASFTRLVNFLDLLT